MKNNNWLVPVIVLVVVGGLVVANSAKKSGEEVLPSISRDVPQKNQSAEPVAEQDTEKYQLYEESKLALAKDKKLVLFFHAAWCPTCQQAEGEILDDLDSLPEDLVVLKIDYDSNIALRRKYNVAYQHYFVQVDQNGNELKAWSGGSVNELLSNPI